jgi:hypothetical protein
MWRTVEKSTYLGMRDRERVDRHRAVESWSRSMGVLVVGTGDTARTSLPAYFPSWHPFYRHAWGARVVAPELEIGPESKSAR